MTEKSAHINKAFLLINTAFFIFLAFKGHIITSDSATYINCTVGRAPVYPLFLAALRSLVGNSYLDWAAALQIAAVLLSSAFLAERLRSALRLPLTAAGAAYCIFIAPMFKLPFGESYMANMIMTEALSYALWLYAAALFLDIFNAPDQQKIIYLTAVSALTVLLRSQFIFLYILIILSIIVFLYTGKITARATRNCAAAFAAIILLSGLADRTHHYLANGKFIGTQDFWTQMLSPALYLSGNDDAALFSGEREKSFFNSVREKLSSQKLLADFRQKQNMSLAMHFLKAFNSIRNTSAQVLEEEFADTPVSGAEKTLRLNQFSKKIFLTLAFHSPQRFIKLVSAGFFSYIPPVMLLLLACTTAFAGALYIKTGSLPAALLAFASAADILNCAVAASAATASPRYMFYTDTLLCAAIITFAAEIHANSARYFQPRR